MEVPDWATTIIVGAGVVFLVVVSIVRKVPTIFREVGKAAITFYDLRDIVAERRRTTLKLNAPDPERD
ncbi:hypothetical protein ACFU98_12745 [Streptomyces sp. NPDC057575]|uniref:hypothetical protein n=1 Tax=unclassified Streptomyces TaxID=2593676 RepID=UPI0036BE5C86